MKLSLNWISDFVDIKDIDPHEIANRLTMATAEIEEVETIERAYEGKFIAEVVHTEKLDYKGKDVYVVTVSTGEGKTFETVCTAPNVRTGLKCLFAEPGSLIAGGDVVRSSELYGAKSEGVLCSPREVGMGAIHEKLLECPVDAQIGAHLSDLLPARETLLDVDNKSITHRADLWGLYGFARELAAIYQIPLKPLPQYDFDQVAHLPAYPQEIKDPEKVNCLTSVAFDVQGETPSPLVVQERLFTNGQKCISLLVDLTNYVALEVGQPTHVHDRAKSPSIQAIRLDKDQTYTALDQQEYKLQKGDLAISNGIELTGLAGIIGGSWSEIREGSTEILLESANFQAQQVRRTATRTGLRTEASQRFEKSLPPLFAKLGAARFMDLLVSVPTVSVDFKSRYNVSGELAEKYRYMELDSDYISSLAGTPIEMERTRSILESLKFTVEEVSDQKLSIGIPPFRSKKDISVSNDIGEEVLRIYGYDNLPSINPALPIKPVTINNLVSQQHRIRRYLGGLSGFVEAQTYLWMDGEWNQKLEYNTDHLLSLKNSVAPGKERLREWLVVNLVPLVSKNWSHRDHFSLFELGSVVPKDEKTGKSDERTHLAGVAFAQESVQSLQQLFGTTKATLEDLGEILGLEKFSFDLDTDGAKYADIPLTKFGPWGRISSGGQEIGAMGIIQGRTLRSIVKSGQVVWFELNLEFLKSEYLYPAIQSEELPVYHDTRRDYTIVCPQGMTFLQLEQILDQYQHPILKKRSFQSSFVNKSKSGESKVSYTFRFQIGLKDRTLTNEDISDFQEGIQAFFQKNGIGI